MIQPCRIRVKSFRSSIAGVPPEDLNDGLTTALAMRLIAAISGYQKPLDGPFALEDAGMGALRAQCLRFDAYVAGFEKIAGAP